MTCFRHVVAVSRSSLPGTGIDRLTERCEVRLWPHETPPTPEQLATLLRDCDGAVINGADRIDTPLLQAAGEHLRVLALTSMGYDAVDHAAVAERGVVVTNTPNVLHETTADLTMALILMARRRLGAAADTIRNGRWRAARMNGFLGLDVHGATLGLVGYGQIAKAVARRAQGFGMAVQHYSRTRRDDELSRWVSFPELLRTSDIVSIHVPLSPETTSMIGKAELAAMKPTATLVNTARGAVVDEQALLEALRTDRLHSAGLDVMNDEPRHDPVDPLFTEPNLVLLPHVGSATEATRSAMVDLAVRNVLAVLDGQPALTPLPGTPATPR
jgi:lactate dehydrogenase-like 2-hydroxyacid dehydrogenase